MIEVTNLTRKYGDAYAINNLNFTIEKGKVYGFLGPNGAGKSTLGFTLMGNPAYTVTEGTITFDGEDITELATDARAKKGMFLSFQSPYEVPGISLESFLRNAIRALTGKPLKLMQFRRDVAEAMEILQMDPSYLERDLNVGFSGGEKKKSEILQLHMLAPELAILDETDSGLDVDAVRIVSEGIRAYQEEQKGSLLIITHNAEILRSLEVDRTHILVRGKIVKSGGPELVEEIHEKGFEGYLEERP